MMRKYRDATKRRMEDTVIYTQVPGRVGTIFNISGKRVSIDVFTWTTAKMGRVRLNNITSAVAWALTKRRGHEVH